MTSLFDLGSSSDSEDDVDYVPPAEELSSDEEEPVPLIDDEKEAKKKRKGKKRNSDVVLESEKTSVEGTKPVEEKKKTDDIYKSFLEEAEADMKNIKNESLSSGISCAGSSTSSSVVSSVKNSPCQSSLVSTPEQLFEFAGETIAVQDDTVKSVTPDSSSVSQLNVVKNSPVAVASALPPVKKRGLESVLGLIQNKKQKLTVLQKSMLDWKSFKKDEGLDQELEKFNRGKGGFIERQKFLQKSDLRSYEIERDLRISKRPTQAKRDT